MTYIASSSGQRPATYDPTNDAATAAFFSFEIDGIDLGTFTSVSGLSVNFNVTSRKEGGGGIFMHHLPGRFEYQPLTIKRPVSNYTRRTMLWLSQMASFHSSRTARLAALDSSGNTVIFSWVLFGVTPSKWTGPSFDAQGTKVVEEELTILYTGFMMDTADMGMSSAEYGSALAGAYAASGQTALQSALSSAASDVESAL